MVLLDSACNILQNINTGAIYIYIPYISQYMYVCVCMCVYIYMYMYMYICMYVCMYVCTSLYIYVGFPGSSVVKNSRANAGSIEYMGLIPGSERPPRGGHGNPSSILAW